MATNNEEILTSEIELENEVGEMDESRLNEELRKLMELYEEGAHGQDMNEEDERDTVESDHAGNDGENEEIQLLKRNRRENMLISSKVWSAYQDMKSQEQRKRDFRLNRSRKRKLNELEQEMIAEEAGEGVETVQQETLTSDEERIDLIEQRRHEKNSKAWKELKMLIERETRIKEAMKMREAREVERRHLERDVGGSIHPFVHLYRLNLIVCTECRYAIIGSHAKNHLATKHGEHSTTERRQIVEHIGALPGLIQSKSDVDRLTEFKDIAKPIKHLRLHTDGLKCDECLYVSCNDKSMKNHCAQAHGWINDQTRGGTAASRHENGAGPRPWRTGVHCQRFFVQGRRQEYFEVQNTTYVEPGSVKY